MLVVTIFCTVSQFFEWYILHVVSHYHVAMVIANYCQLMGWLVDKTSHRNYICT